MNLEARRKERRKMGGDKDLAVTEILEGKVLSKYMLLTLLYYLKHSQLRSVGSVSAVCDN